MKITKTASGKQTVKISKNEWLSIGKQAGYLWGGKCVVKISIDANELGKKQLIDDLKASGWKVEKIEGNIITLLGHEPTFVNTDNPKQMPPK